MCPCILRDSSDAELFCIHRHDGANMNDTTQGDEPAADRQKAIEEKLESRYRLAIDALLCDGVFCDEDATVLEGFRAHLGLDESKAAEIFRAQARVYIRRRLLQFLQDGRLDPNEDAILDDLVVSVGLGPQWGEETEQELTNARQTWALAHGPLPRIETDLGLVGREVAYASTAVEAFEERSRTVGVSYGGFALSLPIFKGLRFRTGQYAVGRQSLRYQHPIGTGDLTVTNQRLIFRSPQQAVTARLTSIIDLTNYSDGVAVQRTTGKPITYVHAVPDEDFNLILWRAWQEARDLVVPNP